MRALVHNDASKMISFRYESKDLNSDDDHRSPKGTPCGVVIREPQGECAL